MKHIEMVVKAIPFAISRGRGSIGAHKKVDLGVVKSRIGKKHQLSAATKSMPHVLQLLGRWLEANNASHKQFPWNAIAVNYNFPYGRQSLHRDRNNEGPSVSLAF